mgnify:CR=1 FL=1
MNTVANTTQAAGEGQLRKSTGSLLFERLGMLPVLIVMYLVFYGLTVYYSADGTSNFISSANNMNIVRQVAINLVLASGMTFVILTAGIDLSVGSMLAVAAVLGMHVSLLESMAWLSLPTFIGVGLLCGLLNGVLVAYMGLPPLVITLATSSILAGVALILGFRTRLVAALSVPILIGAASVHLGNGWLFSAPKGGWEYPVYLIVAAVAQSLLGSGAYAIDKTRSSAN